MAEDEADKGPTRQWLAVRYCTTIFVGCYFPPETGENMIAGLERICEALDISHNQIVLLGDFNARCKEWGDTTNKHKEQPFAFLLQSMDSNELLLCLVNSPFVRPVERV